MTKSSTRPPKRTRRDRTVPPLSDLDMRILALLSRHRVLTQIQLGAIVPDTPTRTLRYRYRASPATVSPGAAGPTANVARPRTTSGRPGGARRS